MNRVCQKMGGHFLSYILKRLSFILGALLPTLGFSFHLRKLAAPVLSLLVKKPQDEEPRPASNLMGEPGRVFFSR